MRSVVVQVSFFLALFSNIIYSSVIEDGIFDDTDFGAGMAMKDSSDLFASDDPQSEVFPMDYAEDDPLSEVFPMDSTEDNLVPTFSISANGCSSKPGDFQTMGKARREDVCAENGDYMNEKPFVLPSFLLDSVTIKRETYCPVEIFEGAFPYLVCSSGFQMDLIDYGVAYQALLNGQLGRFYSHYSVGYVLQIRWLCEAKTNVLHKHSSGSYSFSVLFSTTRNVLLSGLQSRP